jgi:hypothetical protein
MPYSGYTTAAGAYGAPLYWGEAANPGYTKPGEVQPLRPTDATATAIAAASANTRMTTSCCPGALKPMWFDSAGPHFLRPSS